MLTYHCEYVYIVVACRILCKQNVNSDFWRYKLNFKAKDVRYQLLHNKLTLLPICITIYPTRFPRHFVLFTHLVLTTRNSFLLLAKGYGKSRKRHLLTCILISRGFTSSSPLRSSKVSTFFNFYLTECSYVI